MAGFLGTLLSEKEPSFSYALEQFEKSTGYSGIDVRLIADIRQRAFNAIRHLGLDLSDTTPRELYAALRSNIKGNTLLVDTDYTGLIIEGNVISFNQDDVKENADLSFEKRTKKHLVCCLKYELIARYDAHTRTDRRVVQRAAEEAGLTKCSIREYHFKKHGHTDKKIEGGT